METVTFSGPEIEILRRAIEIAHDEGQLDVSLIQFSHNIQEFFDKLGFPKGHWVRPIEN